jgi:MscS family membrane protein
MHNAWMKLPVMFDGLGWWIELVAWIFIALLVWWVYHRTYKYFSTRLSKVKKTWPLALLKAIHNPLACLLWFMFSCWMLHKSLLHLGFAEFKYWGSLYQVAIVIALFAMVMGFISLMQKSMLKKISHNPQIKTSKTSVTASAQLGRITLIVLTVLMLLQITGIPISALLAVGSIGTLTVGLAAKDTLENYMGGAMIFFDRPFGVGEWINLPEQKIEGTVEAIGWRLTKIIGFDKRPYYIPNKIFSTTVIENPSRMTNRRIKKVIGVRYADMNKVDAIVSDIQKMLDKHPDLAHEGVSTFVNLVEFASSSVNILIYAFTKTVEWIPFQRIQQDVLLQIAGIIERHGAEYAFPTRTIDMPERLNIQLQPN